MSLDLMEIMTSPLVQSGRTGQYLRMVLAEAGSYGMPGDVILALDDIAAMLGMYEPLPATQAAHVAGPLVTWRTNPRQPTMDRVHDIEELAFKQRALIAFGGAPPDHMVGTAEIVIAMGNIIQNTSPPDYYDVFTWASLDVLKKLTGHSEELILSDPSKTHWKKIPDDEVLKPGGRLYSTYQEVCTSIRRTAIAAMETRANNSREFLRPVAARVIEGHQAIRPDAVQAGMTDVATLLDKQIEIIRGMFPGLGSVEEEMMRHRRNIEQEERGLS